jgi:hypothetical protein
MTAKTVNNSPRKVRFRFALLLAFLASLLAFNAGTPSAYAAEKVPSLPAIQVPQSARFDFLATVKVDFLEDYAFAQGSLQQPDRIQAWAGTNHTDVRTGVVVVGNRSYINEGDGWQSSGAVIPMLHPAALTDHIMHLSGDNDAFLAFQEELGFQMNQVGGLPSEMPDLLEGIYRIGSSTIRGNATTQYQVRISNAKLIEFIEEFGVPVDYETRALLENLEIKYDTWIDANGMVHQENIYIGFKETEIYGVVIPDMSLNLLITYYDHNNSNINIVAPV